MKITLSVDALQPQLTGIGRYTWELCKGMAANSEVTSLHFCCGNLLVDDPQRLLSGQYRPRRSRALWWLHRWQLRRILRSTLVHGPNYFLPPEVEGGVITVHDLSVFMYPETHPESRVRSFEGLFASSLARASHIITDTATVRRELIEVFSIPENSVTDVPLGVDSRFRPIDDREVRDAIAKWGLAPGKYGLSVAAFEPRKKISELIEAWRRLPFRLRTDFPLVLAGVAGWRNEALHETILEAEAEGWLKHLGYVEEPRLPYLYAGARLFIYPSIYEGFGLPPVEAMASGTPVIVSNRSCLPEVCGDAARLIDPDDPDGFTSAIEECLLDECWQSKMIARGLKRTRLYSWEQCVKNTVAVYRKASS